MRSTIAQMNEEFSFNGKLDEPQYEALVLPVKVKEEA